MARKGFFSSLLSSLGVAVISFFILYFFFPNISNPYLGVAFKKPTEIVDQESPSRLRQLFDQATSWLPFR
ncbi:MAG: hypothetical protein BWY50_01416 [Spirochaetes bacterium ADurb.Bin315]|jgi:hypothetical protein|nr:hypothetical protein [Spirochaetota bacterium]NLL25657.1 hypothetical protein [Spirochaetales bacterium]OQA42546.1 MAG: hypothetical protein BWY50_01416 [Spirochaetes bacterium ADurb.Bin315]TAH58410.1 MAG: hypothetical protein EWM48_01355 [Sphaerochaeta sp.]HNZ94752.1 hypothetical protein [Sphaerochaeta sp.]